MLLFDKRFLVLLKSLGLVVLLYLRYVDDISVVMPPIKPGWFYSREHNSLRFDPEHEYAQMPGDKRTMLVLRDIANTVDPNLSFTVDCPSMNQNGRLPILDLQFWVEGETLLRHGFYKKPMAPERTIMAESAISQGTKRATLFAEGIRRLSAMDSYTTKAERNLVLGKFMNALRISGYGQPVRQDVLKGILARDRVLRSGLGTEQGPR